MSWLYYLLEANLYLILFFAFYYLVLRRETWYQYNRAYLLATSALAFIIPLVQLGMLKPAPVLSIAQPQVMQINFSPVSTAGTFVADTSWTKEDYYLATYLLIACCLLVNLAVKIYKLVRLSRLNAYKKSDKWNIVETDESKGAFSFFNYLFVSPQMALSETVIAHELVHIRQKHSWDIVYFEIIKVVNWFNPIAYLLQQSIKELHEFIADREIAGNDEKVDQYTDFLLGNAYGIHESQLTNNLFNKSLLKKRIMMLHQKRSGNSARLKYLLVLPLSAGLLCASTLAWAKSYGWIDIAPKHATADIPIVPAAIKSIPTPVPASHKDWFHYSIDPSRYTAKMLSDMAADFKTKGYQMDFSDYKDGNASMLKISLRKSDAPNSGVSNTFRIDELKKTGEVIFLGFNTKKNLVFVHSEKIVLFPKPKAMTINMPPPPPAEVIVSNKNSGVVKTPTGKAHTILYEAQTGAVNNISPLIIVNGAKYTLPEKLKPGQYLYTHATDSTVQIQPGNAYAIQKWGDDAKNGVLQLFGKVSVEVIQGKNDTIGGVIKNKVTKEINTRVNSTIDQEVKKRIDKARDNAVQQSGNKFPPPAVASPGFSTLSNYLGKNIHYPASEYEQKKVGNVVIELTISNNRITGAKVINDARPAFANEAVRAAKRYADTVNTAPGIYILGVQFNLSNEKMTKTWLPAELYPTIQNKSNFAGIVEIEAYLKD